MTWRTHNSASLGAFAHFALSIPTPTTHTNFNHLFEFQYLAQLRIRTSTAREWGLKRFAICGKSFGGVILQATTARSEQSKTDEGGSRRAVRGEGLAPPTHAPRLLLLAMDEEQAGKSAAARERRNEGRERRG